MNQNNDTATSQNDDVIFDNDDDDDDDDNGETVLSKAHIKIADTSCVIIEKSSCRCPSAEHRQYRETL